jgi:hypothetical protein
MKGERPGVRPGLEPEEVLRDERAGAQSESVDRGRPTVGDDRVREVVRDLWIPEQVVGSAARPHPARLRPG